MTAAIGPEPLVSCAMVTLPVPERAPYFRQSVADYCHQTWPRRELVIVPDVGDPRARESLVEHVASLGRDDIRIVDLPGKHSLGALRNASIANARGDLVCQWDDDDLYHPERIAAQVDMFRNSDVDVLCLEDAFLYFAASRTLHHVSFRMTQERAFPGSLMVRRDMAPRYPEDGPTAIRGEDSVGLRQLIEGRRFAVVTGAPHLYVYVVHGANTWEPGHYRMIAERLSSSRMLLRRHEEELRAGLAPYDFGPGEVEVRGYNGVAFRLGTPAGSSSR